ncbi:MAG: hypothetical protein Q8N09_02280 [Thermodesulfovibrionia bacterium]|nr:hypothetical protein [Thermodesulfovibrionia bacterium]
MKNSCLKEIKKIIKASLRSRYFGTKHRDEAISKGEILRGVYPEQKDEILRFAQNDMREGLRMTCEKGSE